MSTSTKSKTFYSLPLGSIYYLIQKDVNKTNYTEFKMEMDIIIKQGKRTGHFEVRQEAEQK